MSHQTHWHCPQYLQCSQLVEVAPDVQVLVPDAQMGTGKFHESGMCLLAPNLHIMPYGNALSMLLVHLLAVYPVEVSLLSHTPVGLMILVLLLFAPVVLIEL